jgi:predicted transcriptional regulator
VMTGDVHYCLEDDAVEDVARRMGDLGVRRMPVFDKADALGGMISLDDVAMQADWGRTVTGALRRISQLSRAARSG